MNEYIDMKTIAQLIIKMKEFRQAWDQTMPYTANDLHIEVGVDGGLLLCVDADNSETLHDLGIASGSHIADELVWLIDRAIKKLREGYKPKTYLDEVRLYIRACEVEIYEHREAIKRRKVCIKENKVSIKKWESKAKEAERRKGSKE